MAQIDKKTALEHVNDFFEGIYDTAIKAPIAFGDFLARISGYRDYQFAKDSVLDLNSDIYQKQAMNELKILYMIIQSNTAKSKIINILVEDIQERPAYYIGGLGTSQIIGKTFSNTMIRISYKSLVSGSKIEQKINEVYGNVERFLNISDEEFRKFINDNIDDTPWLNNSNSDYINTAQELGIEKVKIDSETYTIQKGDTLSEIAKENNTTIDKLIENNPWLNEEKRISEDKSFVLIKPEEKLNLTVDNKTTSYGIDDDNSISAEYQIDLINKSVISLKAGQTISHIAQNTPFSSIELLEYNNLTLEDAKNLPVGYKVLVPKEPPLQIQGENGVIKLFKNPDDTFTLRVPDENNNKTNITYDENSDLLIYGDKTNPNKITFTQDGIYEVWEKDSKGIMYQKEVSTDEFEISYKMQENKKVLENIEIKKDNVEIEKLAKYTDFSKEELKEFNHLNGDTVSKNINFQVPISKQEIEGGYGEIAQYTTQDGNHIFIVPNSDGSKVTYATF
ncbi:LysM peptidoglycan-binding domain-containing protein [Malaciobacter mytili]|uniref:LysM peptidoglycan-binding domain-containing protein n=1 Tax=Malaciobacter mytili TaxID=603050 RepID=UPI003A86CD0C